MDCLRREWLGKGRALVGQELHDRLVSFALDDGVFATALVCLVIAGGGLMAIGYGFPGAPERRDGPWFMLYFAGVFLATGALLAEEPGVFRLAASAVCLATIAIAIELILARRLANVSALLRLPEGARLPRLFVAAPSGH